MGMHDRDALLRSRFEVGSTAACAFTYVVIAVVLVWLWGASSHLGLLIWAVALGVLSPMPLFVQRSSVSFAVWFKLETFAEAALGTAWALLPLLAMPEEMLERGLLSGVLLAVLVASSASSSQFMKIHLSFVVPFTTLSAMAYLVADNPLPVASLFLVIGLAFSLSMAADFRATHLQLVDLLDTNEDLVTELGAEHEALIAANEKLDRQAWFDPLTGLHNRAGMARYFEEVSNAATASDSEVKITVAYLDLDGFKQINDQKGHRVGDLVLIAVADRLRDIVGDSGTLCRLGGDEITLLGQDLVPERVGEKLAQVFDDPFHIEGQPMRIRGGIGVASASFPCSPEELMRFADRALYRHKARSDRDVRYQIFDTDMLQELREHETTERQLAADFDAGRVNAWLQPIVEIETGKIIAAEALARWERPDGALSAAGFVSHLAEQHLLGELADRTLSQMEDVRLALAAGGVSDFETSVNVPPSEIAGLLRRHDPSRFHNVLLEITEDEAVPDKVRVAEALNKVRHLGAKVLLDDFGTGFSSLALTTALPIDGLKIDGSFVQDLSDDRARSVVSATISLGQSLGLMVIAEGVESPMQAHRLLDMGVTHAQGFLYSPAVPTDKLIDWVIAGKRLGPAAAKLEQAPS